MRKNLLIIIIAIVILGMGASLVFQFNNNNKKVAITGTPVSDSTTTTSMQEALTKMGSVMCDYKDGEGRGYIVYIKNGRIRSDIKTSDGRDGGSVVMKDKKVYYWSSQGAYVIQVPEETSTGNQGMLQQQQMMQSLEQYKQYCKSTTVADSQFDLPKDVQFQDYNEMMQQAQPTSGNSAPSQTQMDQYLQQYQNSQ